MPAMPRFSTAWRRMVHVALAALFAFAAPTYAGAPFLTDDPGTADGGHTEILFSGQVTHRQGDTSGNVASAQVSYGLRDNAELHVTLPYAFDHVSGAGTNFGVGDIELGLKYRFLDEDENGTPALAFAPALNFPSGNAERGLGTSRLHGALPLWTSKTIERWMIFGGGGYAFNPGPDNANYWFTGLGVTREITSALTLGGEIFHNSTVTAGGKNNTGFNIGAIHEISERHHLLFSVGRNLRNVSANNQLSGYFAWQVGF